MSEPKCFRCGFTGLQLQEQLEVSRIENEKLRLEIKRLQKAETELNRLKAELEEKRQAQLFS